MTIDHTGIYVPADKAAAVVAWYIEALKPLGYFKLRTEGPNEEVVGLGDNQNHADWWIIGIPNATLIPSHHAFTAKGISPLSLLNGGVPMRGGDADSLVDAADRAAVDAFHAAAIAGGGTDNGAPGVRTHYHASYYAAFVKDPVGNNVEVVCHTPPSEGS
jgi:hypothetical protein